MYSSRLGTLSRYRGGQLGRRRFSQAFGSALGRSVRRRFAGRNRGLGSMVGRRRQNTSSGQGVTTQHDERRIYTKRGMPRRMKRRWKRFKSKVLAVSEKDLGSRTVVFNKLQTFPNSTSGLQGLAYCALYSANGTGDSFMSDLASLSALENTGNPTAAAGSTVYDTTKWIFKSGVMDVTFRNTSGVLDSELALILASEAKLEVDVYEILSNRPWSDTSFNASDITGALARGTGITPNIGGTGTDIVISRRGCTPWDVPAGLGYWSLKILKKTKYFVPNGDTFTYQVRDPKRRVMMQEKMQTLEGGNCPGWTRHLLVIFKLVPGLTLGLSPGNYVESLTLGLTRKYFYKIEGVNEDRDQYIVG